MKYHCNQCFTRDVAEGVIYNRFFETNRKDAYIKHLQSPKHLKCIEKVKALPQEEKVTCGCCSKIMTKEAYDAHYNRNALLIDWFNSDTNTCKTGASYGKKDYYSPVFEKHYTRWGEITCDTYKYGAKQFPNIQDYLDFIVRKKGYNLDAPR